MYITIMSNICICSFLWACTATISTTTATSLTRNNFFSSSHTKCLEIYDWETVFVLWSYETMVFIWLGSTFLFLVIRIGWNRMTGKHFFVSSHTSNKKTYDWNDVFVLQSYGWCIKLYSMQVIINLSSLRSDSCNNSRQSSYTYRWYPSNGWRKALWVPERAKLRQWQRL